MYEALRNPRTAAELFPGLEKGTEPVWTHYIGGDRPFSLSVDHFRYVVFSRPA